MNKQIVSEKLAIVIKPLATPFNTSIELIVLPVTGIITKIIARYNNGIFTSPKSGNARFESYAPSRIIGTAATPKAIGLNQPLITFLSSINPMMQAIEVETIMAIISFVGKNTSKENSEAKMPTIIDGPPG